MNGWIYLLIASLAEIGWAVGLKLSESWTRLWPSVVTLLLIFVSYLFLSLALKSLPLGTAYAVWTGIGAVGTALAGILYFGESREVLRLVCMGLIVAGILGLRFLAKS
jgi:quaternary ammonium compound-resistance protein SugE